MDGWIGRGCHTACVEAAEERADEAQARLEEDQHPLAHQASLLEVGPDRSRPFVQLAVGQGVYDLSLLIEKPIEQRIRVYGTPVFEDIDQ